MQLAVAFPSRPVPPIQTQRRRPPPRLRTKTGCLTCRQRRKKCDKKLPACGGCSRNRLVCTWKTGESCDGSSIYPGHVSEMLSPSSQSSDNSLVLLKEGLGGASVSPSYEARPLQLTRSLLSCQVPFGLHSDHESHLLHHFMNYSLPTLICDHAHPIFKEESLLLLSTMHIGPVRDAVFAISSRHLSNRKPEFGAQAMRYYSESVHLLREQVETNTVDGFDDILIMTVVWLYIFEIWSMRRGSSCHAGHHLKACSRILEVRKSSLAISQPQKLPSPWERIIAESILFNSATMALFDSSLASISVPKLRDTLQPFLSYPVIPDSSPVANSPVLGISSEIFYIALEVSQLCYRAPLGPLDYVQALHLEENLAQVEFQYSDMSDAAPEQYTPPHVHQAAELYITAAKILLYKILHPNKTTLSPTLVIHLSFAMDIIRDNIGETPCGQYFTWPVFVISCALKQDDDESRAHIRRAMENIWSKSSSGNVIFVLQILDSISEKVSKGFELNTMDLLRSCIQNDRV